MALWKDNTAPRQTPSPSPDYKEVERFDAPSKLELAPSPTPAPAAARVTRPNADLPRKESLIADDLTIEGKIEGGGSVRIAAASRATSTSRVISRLRQAPN